MTPIQTNYRGWRFRSRTEARWAVFFDVLGIRWEYEPEGFEFTDGTRYLPDFWLPQIRGRAGVDGVFVEVKGAFASGAFDKAKRLAWQGGPPVLCVSGAPEYFHAYPLFVSWGPEDKDKDEGAGAIFVAKGADRPKIAVVEMARWELFRAELVASMRAPGPRVEAAVNAARSARFEFGESGAAV